MVVEARRAPETEHHRLTEDDVRRILEAENKIKFIPAETAPVPKEFNLLALESIHIPATFLEGKLKTVVEYLRMPYVEDNFGTSPEGQGARRAWRKELAERYGAVAKQFFDHNKFNNYHAAYMWIEAFADKYRLAGLHNDPIGKRLIALADKLPREMSGQVNTYKDLDIAEKMRLNGELTAIATEFLQMFDANKHSLEKGKAA